MTGLTDLDKRWLTEAVRLREEHAGPLDDQQANRRARQQGGDLSARIQQRALWLAERDGLRSALGHWKNGARLALLDSVSPAYSEWLKRINAFIDFQEGIINQKVSAVREAAEGFKWLILLATLAERKAASRAKGKARGIVKLRDVARLKRKHRLTRCAFGL